MKIKKYGKKENGNNDVFFLIKTGGTIT